MTKIKLHLKRGKRRLIRTCQMERMHEQGGNLHIVLQCDKNPDILRGDVLHKLETSEQFGMVTDPDVSGLTVHSLVAIRHAAGPKRHEQAGAVVIMEDAE